MTDCEILATCIFFNDRMEAMPATSEWLKARYCRGQNDECARFMVCQALGRSRVPGDLFPTQKVRALMLISNAARAVEPTTPDPAVFPVGKPEQRR